MTIDQSLKRDLLKTKTAGPANPDERSTAELPGSADLDQHLVASSKQVLLKSIEFHQAEQDVSFQLQNLRVKYVALNPSPPESDDPKAMPNSKHGQMNGQVEVRPDDIPAPKKVLFPSDKIVLAWQRCQRVGPGLINMGNTCFLNATLQCLTYTPPLTNYLLSHQHKNECRELGFCIMCELCNHVHRTFNHQPNGQAIRPMVILHKLKHFAKHMHIGRQEDAHEFLRLLIEAMQKVCIHGLEKLDKYSKETSLVYQIFSGYYRSRVICSVCQNKSDTFDPFLDIGLDIKQAPSVTKALERLIRPEMLDGENQYQCKKCNRKVQAQKRFTIQRAPAVLTLCLKRFDFNRFSMGKINKEIAYTDRLNLRPYMSDPKGPPIMYDLYAVLKHEGASCNSGHYYCFVKAANQSWYCMNDAFVSQVSQQRVLNQTAYLLFYIRRNSFKSPMNGGGEPKRDVLQSKNAKPATTTSKPQSLFNGPVGVPVPRPSTSSTQTTHQPNSGFKPTMIADDKPKRLPLSNQQQQQQQQQEQSQHAARHHLPSMVQREKISFQFQHKSPSLASPASQAKPPLVMKKPSPPAPTAGPTTKTPLVTGAGDASRPAQPEPSPAGNAFSSLRPSQGSPLRLGSPMTPIRDSLKHGPDLGKPKVRLTQDASNMNGISKKQPRSGLVPYTAEDSNSSSDSDTNYDQVAAELSKTPAGDAAMQIPKTTEISLTKTESAQGDVTPLLSKIRENHVNFTPMKPPAAAKSLSSDALQLSPTHLKKAGLANSVNLTSIRKPDSPLKLTITTNGQAQRIKSTSHWRTVDSDSQISPSPASDCSLHSNVSTNSTSEWNILEKKDAPQTPEAMKKEAAMFGWNVTPSKCKNSEKSVHDPEEQRTNIIGPKLALNFDSVLDQASEEKDLSRDLALNEVLTSKPEVIVKSVSASGGKSHQEEVRNTTSLDELNYTDKAHQDSDLGNSLLKEGSLDRDSVEEPNEERTTKKKKKKRKKSRSPPDASPQDADQSELSVDRCKTSESSSGGLTSENKCKDAETDLDKETETAPKHKKKKKKKKKRKERVEEEDEVEEEWVERVVEPVQNSEHELLLSNDSNTHSGKHKHKDKHSCVKHKSDRNRGEESDEETDHKHSKPHKMKKHRDKHSLIQRRLEKKLKRRRDRHSSDEYRASSPQGEEHRHMSHDDHHCHTRTSHKRTHSDRTSQKHSKLPSEARKRHSSDDHSSSDYSVKVRPVDSSHEEERKKKRDDSDRHRHSSDSTPSSKEPKSHKDHKHQDSDKESKHSDISRRLNGDGDTGSHRREKKKKKKRKHLDEDDDDRPLLAGITSEDGYKPEKKKKKKKQQQNRSSDAEEDSARDDEVTSKKAKHQVPIQQWDHHIQDGHCRHVDDAKPTKTHTSWDGTHSSSGVVEELGKSSLKAYGPAIKSWDGGCSTLDNEVEQDSRQERQRDPYEEDFDRGKVKKVKKHHDDDRHQLFSGRHNPFQSMQNMRNKDHHGYSRFSHQSHGERPR